MGHPTQEASHMTVKTQDLINNGFNIQHSGATNKTALIEQWQYAVAVDTHRLIGELIKEQRATRKVMERIDRRLAKRVKL